MSQITKKSVICVLLAGSLWGFMGLFRRNMESAGVSTIGIIELRCIIAAVLFAVLIFVKGPTAFKVRLRDIWIFLGSGLVSLFLFTVCYFSAMQQMSLSAAAILLYTAPCFVMLLSMVFFKEKFTLIKLAAMLLALVGCALVSGIGSLSGGLPVVGILLGLGSGLFYALYSIFSRFALNRGYSSLTINFYSCIIAAVSAAAAGGFSTVGSAFATPVNALWAVGTGVVTCFLPYMLYTYGLTGLENGKASIIASVEPVVATVVGIAFFGELPDAFGFAGVVLVLAAIVLLNINFKNKTAIADKPDSK